MFRPTLLATIAAIVMSASLVAQTSPQHTRETPDFKVQVWGVATADFDARMLRYTELRAHLQQGLPALVVTDHAREILRAEQLLARRIREARRDARGGEIFTAEISSAFKAALALETRAATCAAVLDDNPGDFSYSINDTYPKRRPLSTVPPGILMLLPRLPADVYYRFLGRELILHDTRANVILDRIPNAIRCFEVVN
jgi:hypothetical protein